jgi:hypothetical protein
MTPDQYREAIERLGLSQVAAARLLGVDARPAERFLRYLIGTGKTGEHAMRVLE